MDRDSPELSPIVADLSGLKKHNIQVHGLFGTYDLLADDNRLFRERLSRAGIQGEWLEWERQMHVFPLFFPYGFGEARDAVNWIGDVLQRHI